MGADYVNRIAPIFFAEYIQLDVVILNRQHYSRVISSSVLSAFCKFKRHLTTKHTWIAKSTKNKAPQHMLRSFASLSKNFSKSPNICIMEETGV